MINVPIQVRDALREGLLKKEYNFTVYESDGTTTDFVLDNDDLVSESVKFDERMCSDTNLKFGLCEGTSLEFQYFGHGNITGRRIKAELKVQYNNSGSLSWYTIPMGYFTVDQCSRQASTGIIKVTAYNKLKSEYLDQKANILIEQAFADFDTVKVMDIISVLLKEYKIDQDEKKQIPYSLTANNSCNYDGQYFKYASPLYGDHGILGAGALKGTATLESITTNTNVRFNPYCTARVYTLSGNYPVKVRFSEDIDTLDDNLYGYLRNIIIQANYAIGGDAVMQAFKNVDWNIGISNWPFKGLYPVVAVEYRDNTVELYGKTAYTMGYAVGTFSDLNKITLLNVRKIYAMCPTELHSAKFTSSYTTGDATLFFNTTQPQSYHWYPTQTDFDNATNQQTNLLHFPVMPNGDSYSEMLIDFINVYEVTNTTRADLVEVNIHEMADVTLRDLQTADFETKCQFGQISRTSNLFSGIELNHNRLFPAESLYPADDLYPLSSSGDGQAERANKSMYSKLWADEGNVRSFKNLIITYKTTEDDGQGNLQEVEKSYEDVINADGTDNYLVSSNWLFKNLLWTDAEIQNYANEMIAKMQDVSWFPFEMWCAGLPYVETGDEVEINLGQNAYKTYVLRRNIDGIQNLQDEMINGTLDIF